jgi:hypothetical protein
MRPGSVICRIRVRITAAKASREKEAERGEDEEGEEGEVRDHQRIRESEKGKLAGIAGRCACVQVCRLDESMVCADEGTKKGQLRHKGD